MWVEHRHFLYSTCFQYLMKTCHQWAKEHPLVSGVLLFFYLLYLFFPPLFSILFYTFPLVICTAILLGGPHISSEKHHGNVKNIEYKDDTSSTRHATSTDHHHHHHHHHHNSRPCLRPQMSRRTFRKDGGKREGICKEENKDDLIVHKSSKLEEVSVKSREENSAPCSSDHVNMSLSSDIITTDNHVSEKLQDFSRDASCSDTESQDEDDEEKDERNKVVQWTEDDQRNLMDLGSSEIERNNRLESLIAKRRAKKMLSMQPRRTPNIDYLENYSYPYDYHVDQVGSIMVARAMGGEGEHQPGSAPSVLLPTRNPFDLPYDPNEEKPVLTGGSFDEEFFISEQKDLPFYKANFAGEFKEDPIAMSLPSFFTKPRAPEKPGYSRFRRESDAEESLKDIAEELCQEGNDRTANQESCQEAELNQILSNIHDQAAILPPEEEESNKRLETNIFHHNTEPMASNVVSLTESKTDEESKTKDDEEENIFQMESEAMVSKDELQPTNDQLLWNKDRDDDDDDDDDGEESSSSSSSCEIHINVNKNEAFKNSVRKVLACLVVPRNKGLTQKENFDAPSSDLPVDSSPTATIPTKMEERSFYTSRAHHTQTYSIASDMQVEVSEAGSPTSAALDPSSPTDRESLVYDGDVDKDANSGDEDLWGASPHPTRLGELGMKFKLPDIVEESESRGSDHNASDPPTLLGGLEEEEGVQAPLGGTTTASSLSPRSILPEENRKELVDHKSNNGDVEEPRSSVSSSSEGLASQMQGKSEHLAEYLASLPPRETGGSILEDVGLPHFREPSTEDTTIQDENNLIFEMDEDKEESKESKAFEESQENNEQSTTASQPEGPTVTSVSSNGYIEGELNKEQSDQAPFFIEQNNHSKRIMDESTFVDMDATDTNNSFREQLVHRKEAIPDSFSTTRQEDIADYSSSAEEPIGKLQQDRNITLGNQLENEVKAELPSNPIIHEEPSFLEEAAPKPNHVLHDLNQSEVGETNKEGKLNLPEKKDRPQLATIEEANMEPSISTDAVSSRLIDDPEGNRDNLREELSRMID